MKSEFRFVFIERDPSNLAQLDQELVDLGALPARVHVDRTTGDAFEVLSTLVDGIARDGKRLAPAFVFVDPYGFKIPARLLADLMRAGRVELFINVIWRELDMAVAQRPAPGSAMANTLDSIFDGSDWRVEITADDVDQRIDQAVSLLGRKIGAKWWTHLRMVSGGKATRYLLLHLTNHDQGRDLIKDCIWSVCPDGGYHVRKSENPNQPMLIEPEADLKPLRAWLIEQLSAGPRRWSELTTAIRGELWRATQLNDAIRASRRDGAIAAEQFSGRFSEKANPLLRLP